MKTSKLSYERATRMADVIKLLADGQADTKIISGGQSLGPMMNLRLVNPTMLVDIKAIDELRQIREEADAIIIGATVTHSEIEDGLVPDFTNGMMRHVARSIAYRAVRNSGTVGGSLVHADPSADWIVCLSVLGAEALVVSKNGHRSIPVADLMTSAFEVALQPDELLVSVRVPKLSSQAKWGYRKYCRKTGELASAMASAVIDTPRLVNRVVVGAVDNRPIVVADASNLIADPSIAAKTISGSGFIDDPIQARIHTGNLRRMLKELNCQ